MIFLGFVIAKPTVSFWSIKCRNGVVSHVRWDFILKSLAGTWLSIISKQCEWTQFQFSSTNLTKLELSSKYTFETRSKLELNSSLLYKWFFLGGCFGRQVWPKSLIIIASWSLRLGDIWLEITVLGWLVKHKSKILCCCVGSKTSCSRWNSLEASISFSLKDTDTYYGSVIEPLDQFMPGELQFPLKNIIAAG